VEKTVRVVSIDRIANVLEGRTEVPSKRRLLASLRDHIDRSNILASYPPRPHNVALLLELHSVALQLSFRRVGTEEDVTQRLGRGIHDRRILCASRKNRGSLPMVGPLKARHLDRPVLASLERLVPANHFYRSFRAAYLERVKAYRGTPAFVKAMRKRQMWVEPLFAEAKQWNGLSKFRLRRLPYVYEETEVGDERAGPSELATKFGKELHAWLCQR
jgi:hypothetical protein